MKQIILASALVLAAAQAFAQTATVGQSSDTSSAAQSGAMAIGGGAVSATIGGNRNLNNNSARGGNGGNGQGGAASSNVTVNLGSTSGDPSTDPTRTATANAQQVPGQQPSGTYKERIETVGSPGSMSYGVSFSQYNCANTAGVGAGFMGGAFQIGVGKESDPCNARANAAALFSIAQTLAATNAPLSAQLYHAAILLIGNSTSETKEALRAAGVSDWAVAASTTPTPAIVPPAPAPVPEPESRAVPQPSVAVTKLIDTTPVGPKTVAAPAVPVQAEPIPTVPAPEPVQPEVAAPLPSPDAATPEDIEQIKKKMFLPAASKTASQ